MTIETVTIEVNANTEKAERSLRELQTLSKGFASEFTDALRILALEGGDLEKTFKSLALSIADISLDAGLKPLESALSKGLEGLLSVFSGVGQGRSNSLVSSILPFAKGGVVSSPSFFGTGQNLGVAGEAGAEAIMPLARGRDGRLGVQSNGQGVANITVNIATPDAKSFRQSEAQVTATLARAMQRANRSL